MSIDEMLRDMDEDGYVAGIVGVDFNDVVGMSPDIFLDHISDLLVGCVLLQDIDFEVLSSKGDTIILEVTGDPSSVISLHSGDIAA
jgi:hypothetical protein